jgi:hypothetical protein
MNEEIIPRSLFKKLFDLKTKQHGKFRNIERSYKDQQRPG